MWRVCAEEDCQWLAAVLAVDADPWLQQFRQAVAKRAWAKVEQLAAQAEVGHYHPAVLIGLVRTLPQEAQAGKVLLLRRTQQQYPGDFWVNYDLGHALFGSIFPRRSERPARGEELPVVNEAVAFSRVAVGLRPGNPPAHGGLGSALGAQGDVKGAITCYTKALDLDPKFAQALVGLGTALKAQGDLKGAIASLRQALELDPKIALAHYNLGAALKAQGDVKGAIACYHKALELDPKYAPAHLALGLALYAQGDLKEAIACYRKALTLDPKFATAHGALGQALLAQGRFAEARASSQRALDLLPPKDPLRLLVAQHIAQADLWLKLEARLPAILRGEERPKDAAEELTLADLCQRHKKYYAAAARFYADAFAAGAAQSSQRTYNAACAATLAAAGQGEDASKLDAKEKSRLRQQALAWLRDNLQQYAKQLEGTDAKTRKAVRQTLQHWQKDADLASVREKEALAQLPEAERAAWQQLWAEVETLRQKAAAANSP
jgi:tetratricopeptide (TPR) repeat protein